MTRISLRRIGLLAGAVLLIGLNTPSTQAAPRRDWPKIKRSEKGKAVVTAIQYLLRAHGHSLAVVGAYGNATAWQVKRFQRRSNLIETGEVNSATWEALVVKVRRGSRGNAVRAVQHLLRYHGYGLKGLGTFGPQTEAAVKKFQSRRGRTADGIVGLYTWCELVGGKVESDGDD